MAKKKKKNKQSSTKQSCISYEQMNNQPLCAMMPSVIHGEKEHGDKTPSSSLMDEFHKEYKTGNYNSRNTAFIESTITKKEDEIGDCAQDIVKTYMRLHRCDQNLNIFNPNAAINKTCDILDFTKFESDERRKNVLKKAMFVLRDTNDSSNLRLLWSTSEYVLIKYSACAEFAVKRIGYDAETKRVQYEIVAYERRIVFKNKELVYPVYLMQLDLDLANEHDVNVADTDIENEKMTIGLNQTSVAWAKVGHMQQLFEDVNAQNNDFIFPQLRITKSSTIETIMREYKRIIKNMPNGNAHVEKLKALAPKILKTIALDSFVEDADTSPNTLIYYASYLLQKMSIPIACIIIANNMLTTKKLSSPEPYETTPCRDKKIVATPTTDNTETVRKIRHLEDISIVSSKRPSKPDMQKIIRYSVSEWDRRGFLRHYKNGKIVEIQPTVVKRKCIDVGPSASKKATSTSYIIHSEKSKGGNHA